ncbi:Putative DNA sulphur modification protein [Flavobacterium indicum GPTSA100-9 = DSM 17447]|uniref:Putative DNA sulphur modification protein n=1 Tax=Flavobacterium indicum (strain DSM 17447 / CIP 109464 / GPTSA100-9) TaxID=1094466 RepID=H8XTY9_FLAIG|nr:DNA phosphorothioation-associated DGQHR protein 1 [Flavobacterium indicum]CCG53719.1 Putative DNA sulphur modification protein [Flavobacterium indicum GPTSA100-9 = DSM 17447]
MSFKELYAIRVSQPLCDFYVTSISATDLLKISFSEQLQYVDEKGKLQGNQRKVDDKRLKEIGRYIDSVEMSFPNAIILGANYNEDGEIIENEEIRWSFEQVEGNLFKIIIPSDAKLASIIDGQHRLKGFEDKYLTNKSRLNVDLPCSIFFDLPNSYQAFLFATINGNQKRVDKSLALEQFGFNVDDEPQHTWTPEKLAVYYTRKLNFKESPISGHIKIAPKIDKDLKKQIFQKEIEWTISTATIVDGILSLITSNPKRDRVEMAQENIWGKRSRSMVEKFKSDKSPLRNEYLNKKDDYIYEIINNYLSAVKETLWEDFDSKSYIFKTVGIQALFDLLRRILLKEKISEKSQFIKYLTPALKFDFSSSSVQASGIGRKDIRNALLLSSGIINEDMLTDNDNNKIKDFIRK